MQAVLNSSVLSLDDVGVGLPLVFLHGFPLNRRAWQKQIDAFQASYRVIAPDLCGFGASVGRSGETTMEQYAIDVREAIRPLTAQPIVLVGHSMGGYVALAFARKFPEMICGLVLVGTKAAGDTPEAAAARRRTAHEVKMDGTQGVVDTMAPKMLTAYNVDMQMLDQVRAMMKSVSPDGMCGALLGMADRPDSTDFLADITVPTLLVAGGDDHLIPPSESENMAKRIPRAELAVISYAAHLVAFEQPDEFNRVLKEWLERHDLSTLHARSEAAGNGAAASGH